MDGGMNIEIWLATGEDLAMETALQRRVWDELKWEPILDAAAIGVEVNKRVVRLTGTVESYPERVAAERAAKRVPGVLAVTTDLTVTPPAANRRTDADLAQAVARTLEWDVVVSRDRVRGTVANGWVTLEGTVSRDYERTAAEEAVHHLTGLRGLTNLITVAPESAAGPLKARLQAALERSPQLHGDHIKVETHAGSVALHGCVRSLAERDAAERAVRAVSGVTAVEGDLKIGRQH